MRRHAVKVRCQASHTAGIYHIKRPEDPAIPFLMQIHRLVWALSVAFVSLSAAQPPVSAASAGPVVSDSTSPEATSVRGMHPMLVSGSFTPGFPLPSFPPSRPSAGFPASSFATGSFGHATITTVGIPALSGSAAASSFPSFFPSSANESSAGLAKGSVIAAAVGGSIAASLIVVAGVLFCLRQRSRQTTAPAVEGASDVTRRCEALEREVAALRAQLARLEARSLGGGAGVAMYTNEKDGLALDGKVAKDHPPTYVD
ncbi:hypothetical protein B0H19DRAFT_1160631 [Mycena capillaripes]|nr:hypothetical protein B0H19DRAFT_1160631 [Mycena capillaripes]